MKRIILFFIQLLPLALLAQTETAIRAHYTEVNKKITESIEKGFEGTLYHNQWVHNKNGKSWPAVGLYTETTDLWYDDDPNHLPASERDPKKVLLKVNVTRKASHLGTNEEYLFKDGKLVFYYSHEGEEGSEWEKRVYFNNAGAVLKITVKANGKELTPKELLTEEFKGLKPSATGIMTDAKKYQDLFVKSMR